MKRTLLLLGMICGCMGFAFAQKEYNIWYFGANAGLDFNSGVPVAITNGVLNTQEGCSSICDTAGNLLFYTEGTYIYNRNHVQMANGFGLTGNTTATQSAIILKQPGNANRYYVFTTFTTLNYSVVDMNLNSGLGDVTAQKNVFLANGSEKLCATRHANGTDIWVMGRTMYTNTFVAFVLSSAGVTAAPVQSSIGFSDSCGPGQMKFSPDGKKIAVARCFSSPTLYLADFDNSTGIVSGGFAIPTTYPQTYGCEFSPDGTKLYGGANVGLYYVVQFDLSAGSPAAIIASATIVGNCPNFEPGSLQLGPDKKIYISPQNSYYVDVINNPNVLGIGCNYVANAVSLNNRRTYLGLPTALTSPVPSVTKPTAIFTSSDTAFCDEAGKCINFFDHSTGNPTSWQWIFAGATPSTSSAQNPTNICYYYPGTYEVKLVISNFAGSDTLDVLPHIIFGTAPPPPVVTVFGGDTLVSTHSAYYQWFRDGIPIAGAVDSFYIATQGGTYSVQGTDSIGCVSLSNGVLTTGLSGLSEGDESGVVLYPNPVTDELTIAFSASYLNKSGGEATITDMVGKEIYKVPLSKESGTYLFSLNGYSDGVYLLKIHSGDETVNKKFVVVHK